ncbi:hypothetical protein BC941DRAFT_96099 [Chlamydoabsidia padenii]|nr:hypothetical protein BC941DRAFT_96099 [Chlamydoabsidia padenii]
MIFRHPISTLTRITSSTLKYASSNTANLLFSSSSSSSAASLSSLDDYPDPEQVLDWMNHAQQGMDAFFDDYYDIAYAIFAQYASVSPFHALGYALLSYVEAMVSFEVTHIQAAQERLTNAEALCHQLVKRTRRRFPSSYQYYYQHQRYQQQSNHHHCHHHAKSTTSVPPPTRSPAGFAATATAYAMDWYSRTSSSYSTSTNTNQPRLSGASDTSPTLSSLSSSSSSSFTSSSSSSSGEECIIPSTSPSPLSSTMKSTKTTSKDRDTASTSTRASSISYLSPAMPFEVLETNCMLMSATLKFLSNHWVDYMRAVYKLRKTYKKYEQLFEVVTGKKPNDYANYTDQRRKRKRSCRRKQHGGGDSSGSGNENINNNSNDDGDIDGGDTFSGANNAAAASASMIQSGVFFGIGLLSLIFSLLPPKLNKLLNTLGFHSSRPFALRLLQQSYHSQDAMYSSLSALALLAYYTNLSSFIHPKLLPSSLTPATAREIVNAVKIKYPHGKIWKLLEGKLYRMEGCLDKSVQVLRDCRRRDSICMPASTLGDSTSNSKQRHSLLMTMTTSFPPQPQSMVSELALQISALSVYEMGWGQIFLGDYFQASETFFRLESMNNWSRAFYHYIATCCLYGDEEYDKAAIDFIQIPRLLGRRRKSGTRLLANEQFAERTILQWIRQAAKIAAENNAGTIKNTTNQGGIDDDWRQRKGAMDGQLLQQVVLVNPLWELIYLWNGIYYVSPSMLQQMKQGLQQAIDRILTTDNISDTTLPSCSELGRLQLLVGVVQRELGNVGDAETCFRRVITLEKTCLLEHQHNESISTDTGDNKDNAQSSVMKTISWAGSYAMYEMALLKCLPESTGQQSSAEQHTTTKSPQAKKIKEAREWLRRVDQFHHHHSGPSSGLSGGKSGSNGGSSMNYSDVSCESACMLLHIRCQLLYEKLDELLDG